MTIKQILESKRTLLSFEVFPPKKQANFDSVVASARELCALKPDFMSITYGAGGTTRENTVEVASKILEAGVPALAHLTCVGNSPQSAREACARMKAAGVENVLALRGDIPEDFVGGLDAALQHADELARIVKDEGFCIGGACYPEGHPESENRMRDIENLKRKVDAGVDFLTTQMFFDNNMLYAYLYRLQAAGIHVPVFAGIMPITNSSQVAKMVKLSSAYIPPKLLSICDRFESCPEAMAQAGIAYATDQIVDLVSNGIRGVHIYTMNKPQVATALHRATSEIFRAVNS